MPHSHARNGWGDTNGSYHGSSRGGFEPKGAFTRTSSFGSNRSGPPSSGHSNSNGWNGPQTSTASWQATPRNESSREMSGYGFWKDGKHAVGGRNQRMEKELFGDANDPTKQHTGINFEKYDDIPVEATGAGVPEPVTAFTSPPLDPVLLENIEYAMYTTPTPVQKYSIPIVAGGRDLMACAQVNLSSHSYLLRH